MIISRNEYKTMVAYIDALEEKIEELQNQVDKLESEIANSKNKSNQEIQIPVVF